MRSPIPSSRFESVEKPPGSDHVGSDALGSGAERPIRGHDHHARACIGRKLDNRVVSAGRSVNHLHVVSDTLVDAAASDALQNDDDVFRQSSGSHRRTKLADEFVRRTWSIPPPTSWAGSDHVGRIDEQHRHSFSLRRECC